MKRVLWLCIIALLFTPIAARAQNNICPTAPLGDNSNRCASTAFVQANGGAAGTVTAIVGTAGQINASSPTGSVVLSLPSTITQNEIFSGGIDNSVIGGATPAPGTFTVLSAAGFVDSGYVSLTGLSLGTQVSCLGLNSSNAVVLTAAGCGSGSASGTVTSVALTLPSAVFAVSGSPVTASGTLAGSFQTQTANTIFAGPSSGVAAGPTFRSLVAADIPSLSATYLPLTGGTVSGNLNLTGLASGTQASCLGLTSGNAVVAANGACGGGSSGVASLGNAAADSTLVIAGTGSGPYTGIVTAKLNLASANTWSATQTFPAASITNAELANSTISGIALGNNLDTLTFGTHLAAAGSSFNGSAGVTITSDATSADTVSTIVARDGSGNFSAGTITAGLTGHASLDCALAGCTYSGTITGADGGAWGSSGFSTAAITATTSLAVTGNATFSPSAADPAITITPFSSSQFNNAGSLRIGGNTNGSPYTADWHTPGLIFTPADGLSSTVEFQDFGAGAYGAIIYRYAQGTSASPSVPASGNILGRMTWKPYTGSTFDNLPASLLESVAEGTITPTSVPVAIRLLTTSTGNTSFTGGLMIHQSSGASLGTFSFIGTDPGAGNLLLSGNLQLAGSSSGTTILQASAAATGTLTLPSTTDQLVGQATPDTLTNKTIAFSSNTLTGVAPVASPTFTGTVTMPDSGTYGSGGINGSNIGATTRGSGAFTTLAANGVANFTGTFQINSNTITWPAAAISVARTDAAQTFIGNNLFQASGATGVLSSFRLILSTSTTSSNAAAVENDTGSAVGTLQATNSASVGGFTTNVPSSTLLKAAGTAGLYIGTVTSAAPVILFAGGTSLTTNNAITITTPSAIAFNQYTTAGILVNDSSGNITSSTSIKPGANNHSSYGGSAPAVSSCGTLPSIDGAATDSSGTVTVGSVATGCTITFASAYTTFNHCRITSQSAISGLTYAYTKTAITISASVLGGDVVDYGCDGV